MNVIPCCLGDGVFLSIVLIVTGIMLSLQCIIIIPCFLCLRHMIITSVVMKIKTATTTVMSTPRPMIVPILFK